MRSTHRTSMSGSALCKLRRLQSRAFHRRTSETRMFLIRTRSERTANKSSHSTMRMGLQLCFLDGPGMSKCTEAARRHRLPLHSATRVVRSTRSIESDTRSQVELYLSLYCSYVSMTHMHALQVPTYRSTSRKHAEPSCTVSWTQAPSTHRLSEQVDHAQSTDVTHARGAEPTFGSGQGTPCAGSGAPPPAPGPGSSTTFPAHPQSNSRMAIALMVSLLTRQDVT